MMKHRSKKIWLIPAAILLLLIAGTAALWFGMKYDNQQESSAVPGVTVITEKDVTFYDGPGTEDALIFYPGALVEDTAYGDLLQRVAAGGVDCFLVKMPLRFAFTNINAAEPVIAGHSYAHWYLGGHSLGGAMACSFAENHPEELTGLVLLAAYSSKDLSGSGLRVLSVTGTEDGVISRGKQEAGKKLLPADTVYVDLQGGNHAGYGTYGAQKGDGQATITGQEQREQTAQLILSFILTPEAAQ